MAGALFFHEINQRNVLDVEYRDPFTDLKLFDLVGVERRALTLEDVPQEYRPYPGCIFVSAPLCTEIEIYFRENKSISDMYSK